MEKENNRVTMIKKLKFLKKRHIGGGRPIQAVKGSATNAPTAGVAYFLFKRSKHFVKTLFISALNSTRAGS